MYCWYCYWGWPKQVSDIYDKALEKLDGDWYALHFGPSHVVWEDENFDAAESCLENFDRWTDGLSQEKQEIVRWSLQELVKLPLKIRCPGQYYEKICDGHKEDPDPKDYPPPEGMIMVKR